MKVIPLFYEVYALYLLIYCWSDGEKANVAVKIWV